MLNIQEVLAKDSLNENDINFLVANIQNLSEEDKVRLGFVTTVAPVVPVVERPVLTGVAVAAQREIREQRKPAKKEVKK